MRYWMITLSLAVSLFAEDKLPFTKQSLELEINEVKAQIAEEERLWAEEKTREDEAEIRRQERLQQFRVEKADLQKSLVKQEELILTALQNIEAKKNGKIAWENRFKVLSQSIVAESKEFEEGLVQTIPYQKEKRLEAVRLITRDLRQDKISPEEGFSRLFSAYMKEIRMSSDAELYSGEVELPSGEKIAVKYIRVGKQLLAYSSPTGSHVGILRKKQNKDWVWVRQDELNFESRVGLRNAVAVAEGKAVPGFVEIPFWLEDFDQQEVVAVPETPVAEEVESKGDQ